MDNRRLDVTSDSPDHLKAALSLVFSSSTKATFFCEFRLTLIEPGVASPHGTLYQESPTGVPTLILSAQPINGHGQKALYPMDLDSAVTNILGWLGNADYGDEPGIDGSCKKGWRVFNEAWGHVLGSEAAIVAVQPQWAMYGK